MEETKISSLQALDIAVVPPEWVQEHARSINSPLDSELRFDATHTPHVSLAQLFAFREVVPFLIQRLDLVLRRKTKLSIHVLGVAQQGATVSYLLDRSPQLISLHQEIMDAIQEWAERGGTTDAFYTDDEATARDGDVEWVENYRTKASYGRFIPHITLGMGKAPQAGGPFDFVADRLGLFHLGRFCTCRVLLHEWRLGNG